jgi:hypothetical protein
LKNYLHLDYYPRRLNPGKPFLKNLMRMTGVPHGPFNLHLLRGESWKPDGIRQSLSFGGRLVDADNTLTNMISDGDVRILDVPRLSHAREILMKEKQTEEFMQKPNLTGPLRLTFMLYNDEGTPIAPNARPEDGGQCT